MERRRLALALVAIGCGDSDRGAPAAAPVAKPLAQSAAAPRHAEVAIAGTVIDRANGQPVGDVDVVLLDERGEHTTRSKASGAFELHVDPGLYRVFVRDDHVMSVALAQRTRLDGDPRGELAGARDEAMMPMLDARSDVGDIELGVVAAAEVSADVYDVDKRDVKDAVVRLRSIAPLGNPQSAARLLERPVLGTDTAISKADGSAALRVPAGHYLAAASHSDYGGVAQQVELDIRAGAKLEFGVQLSRGCIVTGRVINSDGSPANDGAIEVMRGRGFAADSRITTGTFRWATTSEGPVTLRAWPWHSPPSGAQTFACKEGKRFTDVVLRLPDQRPDLSGTVVDAQGNLVPLAFLDVQPLDPIVIGQQERADSAGDWHVYDMPPARYRVTASAPGLGVADTMVVAPRHDLRLVLGGTGRIIGAASDLVDGSVEVSFLHCGSADQPLAIAHEPRIVPVRGGWFSIDRAPACMLTFVVRWRDRVIEASAVVEPDRAAHVDVELGAPRAKTVIGTVRDTAGKSVRGVEVTATLRDHESAARTDANGHYTLQTYSGAKLVVGEGRRVGLGTVGAANVASEQIDLTLDESN